ncbi:unnamed protein product [Discosporangium mesarthrocarpum]
MKVSVKGEGPSRGRNGLCLGKVYSSVFVSARKNFVPVFFWGDGEGGWHEKHEQINISLSAVFFLSFFPKRESVCFHVSLFDCFIFGVSHCPFCPHSQRFPFLKQVISPPPHITPGGPACNRDGPVSCSFHCLRNLQ